MKMSLSWIFDHIAEDWRQFDIGNLLDKFTQTSAEIEGYHRQTIPLDTLFLAQVKTIQNDHVTVFVPETVLKTQLPARPDAHRGLWFIVKKENELLRWASARDVGGQGRELAPAISCKSALRAGAWKKNVVPDDVVIELSSTAITNRPDLWCARGLAREFATILDLSLVPIKKFIKTKHEMIDAHAQSDTMFTVINKAPAVCKQFAGIYIPTIKNTASPLNLLFRLYAVEQQPISGIVDVSNYVLFDLGQPTHAFDVAKLARHTIEPRMARAGEKLMLLDETEITLTPEDLVITDGTTPVALAGIMGGLPCAIDQKTHSIFIESAVFDGATIRKETVRHKLRTQASMRFERNIDPTQNITALARILKLFKQENITGNYSHPILSVAQPVEPVTVKVSHEFIQNVLGMTLSRTFVLKKLKSLGFKVKGTTSYTISVPSWRATKDISNEYDIAEEVGRSFGYNNIPKELPSRKTVTNENRACLNMRKIKQHCAFGMHMHEVCNYPFFDESWIKKLGFEPTNPVKAKNPLSTNVTRLATSLIPHLLQNVHQNIYRTISMRFFEVGRSWHMLNNEPHEQHKLAGILWDYESKQNFYNGKSELENLFDLLKISVTWNKPQSALAPWFDPSETTEIVHEQIVVGYAGMVSQDYARHIGNGNGFIFELDAQFLRAYEGQAVKFKPLAQYPYIYFDISMLAPLTLTVRDLEQKIKTSNDKIYQIDLIDMFSKKEWANERSLTFRYFMRDNHKTLTKQEADDIHAHVLGQLQNSGVTIR